MGERWNAGNCLTASVSFVCTVIFCDVDTLFNEFTLEGEAQERSFTTAAVPKSLCTAVITFQYRMPSNDSPPTGSSAGSQTLEVAAQCVDTADSLPPIQLGVGNSIFTISDNGDDDNDYVNQCLELQYHIQEKEPTCSYFKVVFKGVAPDVTETIAVRSITFRPYDAVGHSGVCSKSNNFCCQTMSLDLCP